MKKIYYLVIFIFSFIYTQESNWATTRFETFWKKNFTQMIYRDPITFLPYDIKIGYLRYGGDNYYKQFKNLLSSSDNLENNPFGENDNAFTAISDTKYRTLVSLQLDLFRYNFFSDITNRIDIQTGFGFKVMKNLNESFLQNNYKFSPEFQEINVNTTAIIQWRPNLYHYLYYTLGYNNASFYQILNSSDKSTGSGIGQSFGLGFNFIIRDPIKANDLHCGIEINFSKLKFDQDRIKEPDGLNFIDNLNMETIGLIFSFGIGYGGTKTSGDDAYVSMLNRDYILASEQFQAYQNKTKIIYNHSKLDEMINFCNKQIPYQLYNEGLQEYYNNNFDASSEILKKIKTNNIDLMYKVESLKYTIADKLLSDFVVNQNEYSINYQIQYCKSLKNISHKIIPRVDKYLFNIYLKKGDVLLESGNYEEAHTYYIHATTVDDTNFHRLKIKIEKLIVAILNDVYKLLQNKQNVLAYEKLSFAKDISSKNNDIDFLKNFINKRISVQQKDKIKDRMIDIIEGKRKFVETAVKKNIYLGDTYDAVVNVLGYPLNKISRKQFDNEYEMITYLFNQIEHRLFFKNKILIDMERD